MLNVALLGDGTQTQERRWRPCALHSRHARKCFSVAHFYSRVLYDLAYMYKIANDFSVAFFTRRRHVHTRQSSALKENQDDGAEGDRCGQPQPTRRLCFI
jgi:hypothetical protein